MQKMGQPVSPAEVLKGKRNDFIDYNFSVVSESARSHEGRKKPTLKSKLLFMDYRFLRMTPSTLHFLQTNIPEGRVGHTLKRIIKFGREGYDNDVQIPAGGSISRRHCLIINCKDDVWLYDLASTGTWINSVPVKGKAPLIGLNTIRIADAEYRITTDKEKLL